ncbi:hypothetical protein niasHT_035822 [Heterodera trifolii]|uniref:Uncharacterized protein n=1 Tax=Heterodera trifolii TaxID=157864 RepID=A0ABD2HZ57_9BILA
MLSRSDARLILWNTKILKVRSKPGPLDNGFCEYFTTKWYTRPQLKGKLLMTLRGRAAEEVFFGRLIGHHSDMADALILADKIVLSSDSWWNRPANRMTVEHLEGEEGRPGEGPVFTKQHTLKVRSKPSPLDNGYCEYFTTKWYTRPQLKGKLLMTLGGRAAEEVFFRRSIGHHSDMADALILADKIVLSSDSWWNRPANRMTVEHLEGEEGRPGEGPVFTKQHTLKVRSKPGPLDNGFCEYFTTKWYTRPQLKGKLLMTLRGRAAEEVFFGRLIGHHSDMADALILADKIVLSSDSWWNRPANRMTVEHLEGEEGRPGEGPVFTKQHTLKVRSKPGPLDNGFCEYFTTKWYTRPQLKGKLLMTLRGRAAEEVFFGRLIGHHSDMADALILADKGKKVDPGKDLCSRSNTRWILWTTKNCSDEFKKLKVRSKPGPLDNGFCEYFTTKWYTRPQLKGKLLMTIRGRSAEEIFFGRSVGHHSDMADALILADKVRI